MYKEYLTKTGTLPSSKHMLLVEERVGRLVGDWNGVSENGGILKRVLAEDNQLRSRHAGILLEQSDEVGSWYGWGNGEGMYLEADQRDWIGWGERRPGVDFGQGGGGKWGMDGFDEEDYEWGKKDEGWYDGEKAVGKRRWDRRDEIEEFDTPQKGRRRRRKPWSGPAVMESLLPEAGG